MKQLMQESNAVFISIYSRIPLQHTRSTTQQKLSKIETLRLAHNYIQALSQILAEGRPMEGARLLHVLARGLSQATANSLAASLGLSPIHYQVTIFYTPVHSVIIVQEHRHPFRAVAAGPIAQLRNEPSTYFK